MSTVNISPKDVMKLRDRTGLGMGECKSALVEANGDMDAAEKIIREKMKGKMDARTDRAAGEGCVSVAMGGGKAAIVELRSETDFTSRNEEFRAMAAKVAELALGHAAGAVTADKAITDTVDVVRLGERHLRHDDAERRTLVLAELLKQVGEGEGEFEAVVDALAQGRLVPRVAGLYGDAGGRALRRQHRHVERGGAEGVVPVPMRQRDADDRRAVTRVELGREGREVRGRGATIDDQRAGRAADGTQHRAIGALVGGEAIDAGRDFLKAAGGHRLHGCYALRAHQWTFSAVPTSHASTRRGARS